MKKIKLLIVAMLTLSLLGSTSAAYAAQKPEVSPQYTGITSMTTPFSISSTGRASCAGTMSIKAGYSVAATLQLQKEVSAGVWEPVETWDQSSSTFISITKTRYVLAGYDYRLKLSAKVYDANDILVETPYKFSTVIHYP